MNADTVRNARSLLFVPGNRPQRFAKAVAAQPDIVIVDLEDAVGADEKTSAREHTAAWLAAGNTAMVRINGSGTPWHDDDLAMVAQFRVPVMPAKAERVGELERVTELAPGAPVVPLIETAAGVAGVHQLCAVDGVARVAFGSIDLGNELGVDPDHRDALLLHRTLLVLASAAAGLAPPIDGVTTVFTETETVTDDFRYAQSLGMAAKLCIHPAQVAAVHRAAAPTDADIAWATEVVAAAVGSDGSAVAVNGRMIDVPVVERARRILAVR